MSNINWHYGREGFVNGEEHVVLYEVWPIGECYMPAETYDRGVKKWVTLKELNELYGVNWTADQHARALN